MQLNFILRFLKTYMDVEVHSCIKAVLIWTSKKKKSFGTQWCNGPSAYHARNKQLLKNFNIFFLKKKIDKLESDSTFVTLLVEFNYNFHFEILVSE